MAFQNKTLSCADCGATFEFTAEEQEFYKTKGYTNEPKRCPTCRAAKKQSMSGGSGNRSYGSGPRQMFPVKCATCGKDTEVPFEPRGDKPVYCSDCYRKTNPPRKY